MQLHPQTILLPVSMHNLHCNDVRGIIHTTFHHFFQVFFEACQNPAYNCDHPAGKLAHKEESGYPNAKVVATGGLGRIISEGTDKIDIYDSELTLQGMRLIYERTKKSEDGK